MAVTLCVDLWPLHAEGKGQNVHRQMGRRATARKMPYDRYEVPRLRHNGPQYCQPPLRANCHIPRRIKLALNYHTATYNGYQGQILGGKQEGSVTGYREMATENW
jgi:hypothetical protein